MLVLTRILADGLMVIMVLLAAFLLLVKLRRSLISRYDTYARIMLAGLSVYFTAKLVATFWQPETLRPFEKLGVEAGASYLNNPGFPSDHTLLAGFLTVTVWYATGSRTLTLAMAIMAAGIAIGRVLALVHTPLDVMGGLAISFIALAWYLPDLYPKRQRRLKTSKISKKVVQ